MFCIDTNVVIDIFRGDESLKLKVQKLSVLGSVVITPITLCELYKGAYAFYNSESKIKEVDEFINNFDLVLLDQLSCNEFGKIYSELKKKGKIIGEFDIIIAAIVKTNNLILVTRNKKHFKNIDIKIEVW